MRSGKVAEIGVRHLERSVGASGANGIDRLAHPPDQLRARSDS